MLRIGRRHDSRAPRPNQTCDQRQQNLRPGSGHHMGGRRRAIGLCGCRRQQSHGRGFRQPAEQFGRQVRQRIGIGIDPGRKVDERFRRVRKQAPGGAKIAAMQERFVKTTQGNHVGCACPYRHADRALPRLSAVARAHDRPSGHLDRRSHRRAGSLIQSPSLPSPARGREGRGLARQGHSLASDRYRHCRIGRIFAAA